MNDWIDLFKEIYFCECVAWMQAKRLLSALWLNFISVSCKSWTNFCWDFGSRWFEFWVVWVVAFDHCQWAVCTAHDITDFRAFAYKFVARHSKSHEGTTAQRYLHMLTQADWTILFAIYEKSVPRLDFYLNLCVVRTTPKFRWDTREMRTHRYLKHFQLSTRW